MTTQRSQLALSGERGLLAIGFLALTGAIAVAHASPATGYELSLYAETPLAVWGLLGFALCLSLAVSLGTSATVTRRLALCLGAAATLAVVGMPVLRGYWFISGGDAHTHLGWARGIASGSFHPMDLRYPGLHTVTTAVGSILGIDLAHAMMLVIVALCGLFFCFITLSTSLVFESRYSAIFGAFSAFLLLPITTLSTFITPHAMTQAILFSAVVVFLLVAYVRQGSVGLASPTGLLLIVLLAALVVYHPQLAAHLLVAMVAICGVQLLARRYRRSDPMASHTPMYAPTAALALAFIGWSASHELIQSVIRFHLTSTIEFLLGVNDSAGDSVGSQADSLAAIGGSLVTVVVKLLGPNLVFGLLSGLLLCWILVGTVPRPHRHVRAVVQYFTVALVGLTVLFFLYFFGSSGMMYFRVFGFMMLFVTIMGAVALAYGTESITRTRVRRVAHAGIVVAFAVLLAASLVGVFTSPYIYESSPHVTERSMSSHEAAFESADDEVGFVGIRSGPNRYADAHFAPLDRTSGYGSVTGEEIENGFAELESDRYLVVTQMDHEREVIAYKELRYTESQLASIPAQPGVNRLQSSGEVTIYYVDAA